MRIYYLEDFQIKTKNDASPLTIADKNANDIINRFLIPTAISIISEENSQTDYSERKNWKTCWIVDPLDGTKEFIKKNGEFTVNIALVEDNFPTLGVIYVPATQVLYYGNVIDGKSYKAQINSSDSIDEDLKSSELLKPETSSNTIRIVGSRSHMNDDTLDYIDSVKEKYKKNVNIVSKGSSLKFCLVAEGNADVYPRFAPTMEWDTAAGQAICMASGLKVIDKMTGELMKYNRENLVNNYFLVSNLG